MNIIDLSSDIGIDINLSKDDKKDIPDKKIEKDTKKQIKEKIKKISKKDIVIDSEKIKENQNLIIQLSRYGTSKRFSKFLKQMGFKLDSTTLNKLSDDKLKELLERVRTTVNNKDTSSFWSDTILSGISTTEAVIKKTKLGNKFLIDGLSQVLQKDESFMDVIEIINLENSNLTNVSPYTRLMYILMSSAVKTHTINTVIKAHNDRNKVVTNNDKTTDYINDDMEKKEPEIKQTYKR